MIIKTILSAALVAVLASCGSDRPPAQNKPRPVSTTPVDSGAPATAVVPGDDKAPVVSTSATDSEAPATAVVPGDDKAPVVSKAPTDSKNFAIPGGDPSIIYHAFESVKACVSKGLKQEQCDRAQSIAKGVSTIDAPVYPAEAECLKLWNSCNANATKKFSPSMFAFIVSETTISPESVIVSKNNKSNKTVPTTMSFYLPIFSSKDGKFGYFTGGSDSQIFMKIPKDKIFR